eukprot:12802333-Alexandrium_andersonii.AAC.1
MGPPPLDVESAQSPADRLMRLSAPEIDPSGIANNPTAVVESIVAAQQAAGRPVSQAALHTIGGV